MQPGGAIRDDSIAHLERQVHNAFLRKSFIKMRNTCRNLHRESAMRKRIRRVMLMIETSKVYGRALLDGIGRYVADVVPESAESPVDVTAALEAADVDVLVSYLPVGSEEATRWYAERAIEAGCAFVNAIPVFIGRSSVVSPNGRPSSRQPGCPSSATTSRARSARPSAIAC